MFSISDVPKSWPFAGVGTEKRSGSRRSIDFIPGIGLDESATFARIYASQPWVYAVVNKLTRGVARLPLRSYEWTDEAAGENEADRVSDLARLIQRPYPKGSAFKLKEAIVGNMCLYSRALVWKFRRAAGQPPAELWPIDWRFVEIIGGKNEPISHFEVRIPSAPGFVKKILPDDAIFFDWWSPKGPTSPMEALARTLALEDAGQRYAISSFRNAARPAGALVQTTGRELKPTKKAELRREIESVYSNPDNAFRTLLLDGGLDWKAFSHTSQESQTIEHRKLTREEVCGAYDVPPPIVHILDRATFSNIDEQHRMLYEDTFAPWIVNLEESFSTQLIEDEPLFAGRFLAFDLNEVLRASIERRAQAYASLRTSSVYTANELRAKEGLPRIEHAAADAILIPLNMEAIGEGLDPATLTPRDPSAASFENRIVDLVVDRIGSSNGNH